MNVNRSPALTHPEAASLQKCAHTQSEIHHCRSQPVNGAQGAVQGLRALLKGSRLWLVREENALFLHSHFDKFMVITSLLSNYVHYGAVVRGGTITTQNAINILKNNII